MTTEELKQSLRIGNWVMVGGYRQISELRKESFILEDSLIQLTYGSAKPIPLTEEILLKCGFRKTEHDNALYKYSLGTNPVTHDRLIELKWIFGEDNPFYTNGHFRIKHLHQLQNLYYSLTGVELTVNL